MVQYSRIVVALDGSPCSDLAADAGVALAIKNPGSSLTGCHVYAAKLHRTRFEEMEPGLPDQYQEEAKLSTLRSTHDDLLSSGMKLISDAYIAPLAKRIENTGINFSYHTPEGRHYARLISLLNDEHADLLVCGAHGHGRVPESLIGSVSERTVLYAMNTDVLVMREPWNPENRPIVVGIDGSPAGYAALSRAMEIGKAFAAPVDAVAVYDPHFHTRVFKTIADALPEEEQKRFNFPAQEQIHDTIIDRGLERLYSEKLEQARQFAESHNMQIRTAILKGKIFSQILNYAALHAASLIVVGRYGIHHEEPGLIGSNTLNLARLAPGNVLVVAPSEEHIPVPDIPVPDSPVRLPWVPEAEEMLHRIPPFAQGMARRAIEEKVRSSGGTMVTPDAVSDLGNEMGMGRTASGPATHFSPYQPVPADRVVFRKVKRFAPDFHRHMVGAKVIGRVLKKGDRELVYEVDETSPQGPVLVTEQTKIEFR